jgi:hypothetical protein
MLRRRAGDCTCALVPAQATPTRHRAATAPSRLESRRSQFAATAPSRLESRRSRSAARRRDGGCYLHKIGLDSEPSRTGSAGFQPASRAGGSMPPACDRLRWSRATAHARRRAGDCACALVPAQATPTRHRAATAPSRLESRRSQSAATAPSRLESRRSRSAARRRDGGPPSTATPSSATPTCSADASSCTTVIRPRRKTTTR